MDAGASAKEAEEMSSSNSEFGVEGEDAAARNSSSKIAAHEVLEDRGDVERVGGDREGDRDGG